MTEKKCLVQSQKGPTTGTVGLSRSPMDHRSSKAKTASSLSPVPHTWAADIQGQVLSQFRMKGHHCWQAESMGAHSMRPSLEFKFVSVKEMTSNL